jgi:hypothetical protein
MLGVAAGTLLPTDIQADDLCTGHKGLQTPRPELSCDHLDLRIYPSPDGSLRAVVYPADVSLDVTPDMESRVVIRTGKGETLERLFVTARFQRVLRCQRKMVAGLEILRLQYVVFGRSQPLAISHDRVWPRGSTRQREEPDCRI